MANGVSEGIPAAIANGPKTEGELMLGFRLKRPSSHEMAASFVIVEKR
jgi:hypothetical protein